MSENTENKVVSLSLYTDVRKRLNTKQEKFCPLSGPNAPVIDYKNIRLLLRYISERGKIFPRRITSISAAKQRELRLAIKRARLLALIPFVKQQF